MEYSSGYESPEIYDEVSNIMETFNFNELKDIFDHQLADEDLYISIPTDHLTPLHTAFRRLLDIKDTNAVDVDATATIQNRYNAICEYVAEAVASKNGMEIADEINVLVAKQGNAQGLATVLYSFFVLDKFYVIQDIINTYIAKKSGHLAEIFKDSSTDKKQSTYAIYENLLNVKQIGEEYAIIGANLYDVSDYIFSMLDMEDIFDYISDDYVIGTRVRELVDTYTILGDFVNALRNTFKENITLRSKVVFEVLGHILRSRGKEL